MKHGFRFLGRLLTLVMVMASVMCAGAVKTSKMKSNTFKNPDFAFPKTVIANAESVLNDAMKKVDGSACPKIDVCNDAIKAAMQICVSNQSISRDSAIVANTKLMASLADKFVGKGENGRMASRLCRLLEATLYCEYYGNDRWAFNNRGNVPASGENPAEWGKRNFSDKISGLIGGIFSEKNPEASFALSDISALITTESPLKGLSVYDFMALKSIDLLDTFSTSGTVIPFGNKSDRPSAGNSAESGLRNEILTNALEYQSAHGYDVAVMPLVENGCESLDSASKRAYLERWYENLRNTPYCAGVLSNLYSLDGYGNIYGRQKEAAADNESKMKAYSIISDYLRKFPDCYSSGLLNSILSQLMQKSIELDYPDMLASSAGFDVKAKVNNVNSYFLLLFKLPSNCDNYVKASVLSGSRPYVAKKVECKGEVPFGCEQTISFGTLPPGDYVVVPSEDTDARGIHAYVRDTDLQKFKVSDISMMVIDDGDISRVYVVNSSTQKPEAGVAVEMRSAVWREKGKVLGRLVTNSEGYAEIADKSCNLVAKKDGACISSNYYKQGRQEEKASYSSRILTDLSIYHPGDTVGFVAVAWKNKSHTLQPLAKRECELALFNSNMQVVDSLTCATDEFGRISGKFKIPEKGLAGTWQFSLMTTDGEGLGWQPIEVAEYKAPTFFVEADSISGSVPGDVIKIRGRAKTYSGMPVADAPVTVDINYNTFFRWFTGENARYGISAKTDENGDFTVELPTEGLKGTPYATGTYSFTAAVTSAQGETQTSPVERFSLGKGYHISSDIPAVAEIGGKELEYDVKVIDMLGNPVAAGLKYEITNLADNKVVDAGEFTSPVFRIGNIGTGKFRIDFKAADSEAVADSVSSEIVLYNPKSDVAPCATSLWLPQSVIVVDDGSANASFKVGTSYADDYLFVAVSDDKGVVDSYWLKPSAKLHELKVKAPKGNNRTYVTVQALHDFKSASKTVTLIPAVQNEKMTVKAESFRDRLTPGAREKWTFHLSTGGFDSANTPAMAVMSNKALNAIAPFEWMLNPYGGLYWNNPSNIYEISASSMSGYFYGKAKRGYKDVRFEFPEWIYGIGEVGYRAYGGSYMMRKSASLKVRGTAKSGKVEGDMAMPAPSAVNAMEEEVCLDAAYSAATAVSERRLDVRKVEYPLAFFMPLLTSDGKGNVDVEFEVPDFNTTWQFQLAAYDRSMRGDVLKLDAEASKPVMVSVNMPRFLRCGDKAVLKATVFNNTGISSDISSSLSVVDVSTGMEIAATTKPLSVKSMAGETVSVEFTVPSDCNAVYIKAVAGTDVYSDGEGGAVVVLPSSQPLIESTPIYIGRGEDRSFERELKSSKNGNLTLKYCNNPVWSCVTALPDLVREESDNIFSAVVNLYGNAVAAGLVKKYPVIADALKFFSQSQNESLESPLQKYAGLKSVELDNTPWVNGAASETQRMSQLVQLTDIVKCNDAIESCMAKIQEKQNPDGSWSWFDTMPPSLFITMGNVLILGELNTLGYLPKGADDMLAKAVTYCDAEWVKASRERYFSPLSMTDYLFARTRVDLKPTAQFAALKRTALSAIRKNWRDLSIYNKATAAHVLVKNGYADEASMILESLSQFASQSEEKGMWWDNLSAGWNGDYELLTTARILQAWHAVDSSAPEIDAIRQWLLMNRQTQNWGNNRFTSEAISTLLTTGSDWTSDNTPPVVSINGNVIDIPRLARLTGEIVADIPSAEKSIRLEIQKKSPSPAWGGVINQYVEEIGKVKAASIPQVSIIKSINKITETAGGITLSEGKDLKVGDKVRVTLTISCDRNMDYVAVTDARAACLEPTEQLSGYTSSDGIWMYKEIRNVSTNLFFSYLPKGTHVITYDCYIDRAGDYSSGIAQLQSQYAPELSAHSAGVEITVSE